MSKSWMTHLPHFLDDRGNISETLPQPARRLAKALCGFVVYATFFDEIEDEMPSCFAIIKKKRCRGKVLPLLSPEDDNIVWQCESCESWGIISGWQGTLWDLSERYESQ